MTIYFIMSINYITTYILFSFNNSLQIKMIDSPYPSALLMRVIGWCDGQAPPHCSIETRVIGGW